jgi:TolB protein
LDNIRKADARPVTASNSAQIDVPYSLRVVKTQRLTSTPDISEYPIAWSPDGKYLAATVFAGNWGSDIHMEIIPVKDGQRRRLLPPSSFYDFHPVWSPDGTRIAFFSNRSGNLDVWTVNSDGTNLTQLTTSPADDLYSVWSPDGEKIAFLSTRSKEAAIWIMNGDGTDQRQITAGGNGDWGMAWNPHNGLIAFGSTRLSARNTPKDGVEDKLPPSFADMMVMGEPSRAIWTVDLQTFILKKLTQEKENGVNWHPVWSPDGKKIAYISNKAGTEDVWVMDYDGGHPAQLTSSELYEVFPVWSPDGAQLAYASSKHYKDYSDIKILTLEKEKLE